MKEKRGKLSEIITRLFGEATDENGQIVKRSQAVNLDHAVEVLEYVSNICRIKYLKQIH